MILWDSKFVQFWLKKKVLPNSCVSESNYFFVCFLLFLMQSVMLFQLTSHSRLGVNSNFLKLLPKCHSYNSLLDVRWYVSVAVRFFLPTLIFNKKLSFQLNKYLWKVLPFYRVRNFIFFLIFLVFIFKTSCFCLKEHRLWQLNNPPCPLSSQLGCCQADLRLWATSSSSPLSRVSAEFWGFFLLLFCFAKRGL